MTRKASPPSNRRRRGGAADRTVPAAIAALFCLAAPATAIDWCHDYTQSAVTGSDSKGVGPKDLRDALGAGGFQPFSVSSIPPDQVDQRLRPGDVIIFGDAHSGIVGPDGKINHYIQQRDENNRTRIVPIDPKDIRDQPTFGTNTFQEIRDLSRNPTDGGPAIKPYKDGKVQLWRPPPNLSPADLQRIRDELSDQINDAASDRDAARNTAQQAARNASQSATRTGIKPGVPHMHHTPKPPVPHAHHAHRKP